MRVTANHGRDTELTVHYVSHEKKTAIVMVPEGKDYPRTGSAGRME